MVRNKMDRRRNALMMYITTSTEMTIETTLTPIMTRFAAKMRSMTPV